MNNYNINEKKMNLFETERNPEFKLLDLSRSKHDYLFDFERPKNRNFLEPLGKNQLATIKNDLKNLNKDLKKYQGSSPISVILPLLLISLVSAAILFLMISFYPEGMYKLTYTIMFGWIPWIFAIGVIFYHITSTAKGRKLRDARLRQLELCWNESIVSKGCILRFKLNKKMSLLRIIFETKREKSPSEIAASGVEKFEKWEDWPQAQGSKTSRNEHNNGVKKSKKEINDIDWEEVQSGV